MKYFLVVALLINCLSCSDAEFYSTEAFKDQFTQGLFISKLTGQNIPYQFDYHMGQEYVLIHHSFKDKVMILRRNSLKEARSLTLINLESECSQEKLSKAFTSANVFHMTLSKRDIPMIRVTSSDHNSKKVSDILSSYGWRCE